MIGSKAYVLAWPAPDFVTCERARSVIEQPTHDKTYCTVKRPKADAYGPPLPATS